MSGIHLIHVVESSGRHVWFEQLLSLLQSDGFSQSVVTLSPQGEINAILESGSVDIHSTTSRRRILGAVEAFWLVRKARRDGRQNFLVLQGHRASIIGSLVARGLNLDYSLIHHVQPKYFELMKVREPFRARLHQFMYRYYIRHAKIIQSLSMEVKSYLISQGCDPRKIVSVGHGVDFEAFQKALADDKDDISLKSGFPRVLIVARLAWEKNYPLAIEVFDHLKKSFPDAQLSIAGTGPMQNEVEALVARKNLQECVTFLGRVSNVARLMKQSDLLLHLAKTESYGQVYIESCLANLPIFAFPTGVAADLDQNGEPLVHILESASPSVISEQIREFLVSPIEERLALPRSAMHFHEHDEREVFQKISVYLTRIVPESE